MAQLLRTYLPTTYQLFTYYLRAGFELLTRDTFSRWHGAWCEVTLLLGARYAHSDNVRKGRKCLLREFGDGLIYFHHRCGRRHLGKT